MTRYQFENNILAPLPPELEPYETFPYIILPPLREDLEYKVVEIADGRVGIVIDRKLQPWELK